MSESTPVLTGLTQLARHFFVTRTTTVVTGDDGTSHVVVANLRQSVRIATEVYLNEGGDPDRLVYELDGCQGRRRGWRHPDVQARATAYLVGRLRRERKLLQIDQRRTAYQQRRLERLQLRDSA